MFDIGFWELALIGVVALLVVGPERLPALARTAGIWVGKARRFVSSVKADVEKEIRADELKRVMKEQAESSGIHEIVEETRSSVKESREEIESTRSELEEYQSNLSGNSVTDEAPSPSESDPRDSK
ncbi:Sec-independent protein translocase protein TatB [Thiohalomonas denitrificans]|uniref:Sec-independent protein translocase protein TatB n=1 Tax=Thiohalomonas denitrificans TaxID=415747 RepID=A0A1G5QGW7_9GAMM|nr:Sec-independent protein translocase protein TatB [Thiohalomonas denitrificans]SCZ60977.1 sec-independent protein translocase protein TatB [Thiohalomonas denitrificans]